VRRAAGRFGEKPELGEKGPLIGRAAVKKSRRRSLVPCQISGL